MKEWHRQPSIVYDWYWAQFKSTGTLVPNCKVMRTASIQHTSTFYDRWRYGIGWCVPIGTASIKLFHTNDNEFGGCLEWNIVLAGSGAIVWTFIKPFFCLLWDLKYFTRWYVARMIKTEAAPPTPLAIINGKSMTFSERSDKWCIKLRVSGITRNTLVLLKTFFMLLHCISNLCFSICY